MPMAGPIATPAFVAAETQPSDLARSSGLRRVRDVRLHHADRPAARALHEAAEEQQLERMREGEHDVRQHRRAEADHQRGTPADPVRHAAPERRAHELRDREHREEQDTATPTPPRPTESSAVQSGP